MDPRAPVRPRRRLLALAAFAAFLATVYSAVAVHPAFLLLHGFCAVACATLAPSRGRRAYVWAHAGLAFGVFALVEVLRRPPLPPRPPGGVEAGVSFAGVLDFLLFCGVAQVVVEDRLLPNRGLERPAVVALLGLFLLSVGALVWTHRSALFRYLTNVKTALALVTYLGISSFLMTVILQQPDAEKAYLQDQALLDRQFDDRGRPMTDERREYLQFMGAQTALVYGLSHLFEGAPEPSPREALHEERLRAAFGPTQGHNLAEAAAHRRENRRKQLERDRLAKETDDDLWGFFRFAQATRLYEVRRSWWLVIGVLDLLALCLVCVCVDRWRRRTKRYAFYFAHAGLVLVIAGRHFTDDERTFLRHVAGQSRRGHVDAFVDRPTGRVQPFEVRDDPWRLPFDLRLDRFEVDYYKEWVATVPDREFGTLSNRYVPREGKRVDLFDEDGRRWRLAALEHHLSVDFERRVVADERGPHPAGARVRLSIPKAPFLEPGSVTLVAGHDDLAGVHLRAELDAYVRLVHATDDASFERETAAALEQQEPPFGRLEVRLPEGGRAAFDVPPRRGDVRVETAAGALVLRVEEVWKDEAAFERSRRTRTRVPLWAQAEAGAGVLGEIWFEEPGEEPRLVDRVLADATGFAVAGGAESPLARADLRLVRTRRTTGVDLASLNAKVVVGPGGKASLVFREEGATTATPLETGVDTPVGKTGLFLAIEEVLGPCRVALDVRPVPDEQEGRFRDDLDPGPIGARRTEALYVSATRFRVEPPEGAGEPPEGAGEPPEGRGESWETWLTSADAWPLRFGPGRAMTLSLREDFGNARDYRSYVSIVEGGRPTLSRRLVQVNDPLAYRGYKIYQMRFRAEDPDYSGFLVKRDRGLPFVYAGLPLTFLGISWMLLVDPALARRRNRLRKEALP